MTREEAITMLPCYVSGDLPPTRLEEIDALVEQDDELEDLVDQLRRQHTRAVRALCHDAPPPELAEDLDRQVPEPIEIARVPSPEPETAGASRWPYLATFLALTAALLLAIGLIMALGPPAGSAPPDTDGVESPE